MEKKEPIKISLPVFIAILVLLVAIVFGCYMFMQNQKLDKEIASLKDEINKSQATKNELQEKLNSISNTINTNNSTESNTSTSSSVNSSTSFTDEQVKTALANYLELEQSISDEILEKLTNKGVLNYKRADNTIDKKSVMSVITKIKYEEYKKAMLNYVSEDEFEKKWTRHDFEVNNNGYLTFGDAGGAPAIYTIKSIDKIGDLIYSAKTSYIIDTSDPASAKSETYTFTVKDYNGHCVIDSINEQ